MNDIQIAGLTKAQESTFYALAAEYLPDSDPARMRKMHSAYSQAYLTLSCNGELIGVAYGWLRRHFAPEDPSFTLDGIAVRWDYQRKGYGRQLLSAFEQAAKTYGAPAVSAGSGEDSEEFYLRCGYFPKEYKVWRDGSPSSEAVFNSEAEYRSYCRPVADGFLVVEKNI